MLKQRWFGDRIKCQPFFKNKRPQSRDLITFCIANRTILPDCSIINRKYKGFDSQIFVLSRPRFSDYLVSFILNWHFV